MPELLKHVPKQAVRFYALERKTGDIDEEKRTVTLSFSSNTPLEMDSWQGTFLETLEHKSENVRLGRLNTRAPLLFNHNRDQLIGVVETASVDGKKGFATVRFSNDEEGEKRFQQVKDGILANVSVGYIRHRVVSDEDGEGRVESVRVTDWEPLEVSLVTIPADVSVGVGRDKQDSDAKIVVERQTPPETKTLKTRNQMPEVLEKPEKQVDVRAVSADATKAERQRVAELEAVSGLFKSKGADVRDLLSKAKAEGYTVSQFREHAIGLLPDVKPAGKAIEMPKSDQRRYSISRAIRCAMPGGKLDGLEGEWHNELLRNMPKKPAEIGIIVPNEIMGIRTMTAGGSTSGAELVSEETLQHIGKLDNQAIVEKAGARRLTGLQGDIVFPKITGGATAYWLGETESATASDLTTGTVRMTPRRLGVFTKVSNQLSVQANESVEAMIREDMNKRTMLAIDLAALQGTGADGQPKGLFNFDTSSSGINTVTYGAAATFAKVNEAIATILTDNAYTADIAQLITPSAWGAWASKSVDSGSGKFLWNGGLEDGKVGVGIKGYITNQLPSNKSIVGVWSELMFGFWQGANMIVDPYTSKTSGLVELYVELLADIAVRHAESFCISTDSAAQ